MPTIAICGETYSQNLGDGVIAESMAYLINRAIPEAKVVFIDISNRVGVQPAVYGAKAVRRSPGDSLRCLHRAAYRRFSAYRRLCAMAQIAFWEIGRNWRHVLVDGCDLMIIGGGQLVMDNDLSFPTKLFAVWRKMKRRAATLAFHSCGVGGTWSWIGRLLVGRLLREERVIGISVRDTASLENLRHVFGIAPAEVEIVYDPALWADKVYGIDLRGNAGAIGLGIMAPLAYFSSISSPVGEFCTDRLKELWCATVRQLAREGHAVVLFSNGAPEDQRFAEEIFESIPDALRGAVSLSERPKSPEELVKMLSGFKAIVAQRLHAHIIAYAAGVPSVGLIWDSKVKEFGELTRRQEFFLEPAEATAEKLVERVRSALAQGINSEHRRRLRDNAYFGVVRLLSRAGLTTGIPERSAFAG